MNIEVISFGKLKNPGFSELSQHYQRLLQKWASFTETELKPAPLTDKSESSFLQAQKKDQESLLHFFEKRKSTLRSCILLDESGVNLSSEEWSKTLEQTGGLIGGGMLYFCIGSSVGFSEWIKKNCLKKISLGRQTLSHELARVVLYEQLFRAMSILNHHPYHHSTLGK